MELLFDQMPKGWRISLTQLTDPTLAIAASCSNVGVLLLFVFVGGVTGGEVCNNQITK
jgi:hypothetical protein